MVRVRPGFVLVVVAVAVLSKLAMYIAAHPAVAPLLGTSIKLTDYSILWNLSPLPAICLFGAARFSDRRWAFAVPLIAWALSDMGIWALTDRADWAGYGPMQCVVYAGVVLMIATGLPLRRHRAAWAVATAGLAASVEFFVLTNAAMWIFSDLYPHTPAGLLACFAAGLPFFGNSLLGMALFLPILFSPLALTRPAPLPTEAPATAA